jgi:MFS family permease
VGPDLVLPIGASIYFGATVLFALAHDSVWMVAVVMAGAGAGGGFTFAAMPGLVLRSTPPRETGSAMAFNVLLRYLGFAAGSTLATTLLAMFSAGDRPDRPAFLAAVWINAGLWLATALICCALIPSRNKETP